MSDTLETPQRWQQVKKVLEEALALRPDERPAYLDTACADDTALRTEVDSFLTVSTEALDQFMEAPVVDRPPPIPDDLVDTPEYKTTGSVEEFRPLNLAPYTKIRVATRTSEYHITVVAPLDLQILVEGGRRFPEPTRAWFHQDVIAVGRQLRLQVGTRQVVTTRIVAIDLLG